MELRALLTVSLTTLLLLYRNRAFFNLENPLALTTRTTVVRVSVLVSTFTGSV